ncbi:hypothetical protein WA158_002819 [Blastocystis sp. Blastoise]
MSQTDSDFDEALSFGENDDEIIDGLFDIPEEDNDDESDFEDASTSKKRKSPAKESPAKAPAAKRQKKETGSVSKAKKPASSASSSEASMSIASKDSKVKELTEKEAYPVILNYINEQNKPFSSTIVYENLHRTVKKAHAVRVLAQLAQDGKIIEKEYGKTKIYYADQNQFPSVSEEELVSMEEKIATLKEQEKDLLSKSNIYKNELKSLQTSLPDSELKAAIEKYKTENEAMETKLNILRNSGAIDKTELDSLQTNVNKYTKIWKQRRHMCMEGIKTLADGLEKKDQEVIDEIGLETEEELGIELPFKK